jgi:hypothetical protein
VGEETVPIQALVQMVALEAEAADTEPGPVVRQHNPVPGVEDSETTVETVLAEIINHRAAAAVLVRQGRMLSLPLPEMAEPVGTIRHHLVLE